MSMADLGFGEQAYELRMQGNNRLTAFGLTLGCSDLGL